MTKHQNTHLVGEDQKLLDQQPNWLESLRRNFDAEVHLPADISREFLSAVLLWAIDNKVDFGLSKRPTRSSLRTSAVMRSTSRPGGSTNDGTSALRTKSLLTREIEVETKGGSPPLVFAFRVSRFQPDRPAERL